MELKLQGTGSQCEGRSKIGTHVTRQMSAGSKLQDLNFVWYVQTMPELYTRTECYPGAVIPRGCSVPVQYEARPRPVATIPVCFRITQHTSDPRASGTPVPMTCAYGQDSASSQGGFNLEMVINTEGKPATSRTYRFCLIQCRVLALSGTENYPMTRRRHKRRNKAAVCAVITM